MDGRSRCTGFQRCLRRPGAAVCAAFAAGPLPVDIVPKEIKIPGCRGIREFFVASDSQEELDQEQQGDDVGQHRHILELAGEHLDEGVGNQTQTNGVADGAGNRHAQHNKATDVIFLKYHEKSIFSNPIATTPAAEPMISKLPPTPAQ